MGSNLLQKIERGYAKKYIKSFKDDELVLGRLVGQGLFHVVYKLGKNKVVKVPLRPPISKKLVRQLYENEVQSISLLNTYFKGLIPKTKVVLSPKKNKYIIIQDVVGGGSPVLPTHKEMIRKVYLKNKELMKKEGLALDFLGLVGLKSCVSAIFNKNTTPKITNILISKSKRVFIVDTNLLELKLHTKTARTIVFWIRDRFRWELTKFFLKMYFL